MAKLQRVVGSTSHVLLIFAQDSSSTTGAGLTGLAYNTAGLTCYYKRNTGTASVAVTLADITTLGTFVSGGFKAVDGTNMPGLYEFHPPDAAFASGARSVAFMLKGATNLAPVLIEIELTATDNQDATRFGLAALPGAAAAAANGLITRGTGAGQLSVAGGVANANLVQVNGVVPAPYDGTLAAATAGTATLDAAAPTPPDHSLKGWRVVVRSAAGNLEAALVADNTGKVLTLAANWITTPDNTYTYTLDPAQADVVLWRDALANALVAGRVDANTQATASGLTFNLTGNVTGSVGSVATGGITAASFAAGAIDAAALATDAIGAVELAAGAGAEVAAAVWDLATAGHTTSGTFGAALTAAGSAGDPWSTSLPGSYGAGTAGYILGGHLGTVAANVVQVNGSAASVTTTVAANVTQWKGATPNDLASGRVDANATASLGSTAPTGWINAAAFATGTIVAANVSQVGGFAIPTPAVAGYLPVDVEKVLGVNPTIDTDPTPAVLTAAGLDAITVETGLNLRQAVSILLAYVAGVKSGVITSTPTISNPAGTATRAQPIVDPDGNCSANTLSPPA
jgi:hypothetical protein